jgi:hypothetical protein
MKSSAATQGAMQDATSNIAWRQHLPILRIARTMHFSQVVITTASTLAHRSILRQPQFSAVIEIGSSSRHDSDFTSTSGARGADTQGWDQVSHPAICNINLCVGGLAGLILLSTLNRALCRPRSSSMNSRQPLYGEATAAALIN